MAINWTRRSDRAGLPDAGRRPIDKVADRARERPAPRDNQKQHAQDHDGGAKPAGQMPTFQDAHDRPQQRVKAERQGDRDEELPADRQCRGGEDGGDDLDRERTVRLLLVVLH